MTNDTDQQPAASWRRLGRYLWAGTAESGPLGTVELGWHYRAIDPDGAALGRCRTLDAAQQMLEQVASGRSLTLAAAPAAAPWLPLSTAA